MQQIDFTCRDCGAIFEGGRNLPKRGSLRCPRCSAVLWRAHRPRFADPRALVVMAALVLLAANMLSVFDISVLGDHRRGLIASGAASLVNAGGAIAAVGVLVAMTAVAIPAVDIGLMLVVIFHLAAGERHRDRIPPLVGRIWRAANRFRAWSMPDVFLVAAVVAYSRLGQLAAIAVGAGGYALAAFVLLRAAIEQMLGRFQVWDAIADWSGYSPPASAPWVLCLDCELVSVARTEAGGERRRCPRCGARPAPRRPLSVVLTTVLCIAGCLFYLPANLLPVLSITRFGFTKAYTIMSGVRDLAGVGMWPLALIVLLASIVIPAVKLATLAWCLVAIRWRSARLLRARTVLYRFVKSVGRWSFIDVFVVAIVVSLVQFGFITRVEPGPGIACFAAVVVLTMIASDVFDPRLMWDAVIPVTENERRRSEAPVSAAACARRPQ